MVKVIVQIYPSLGGLDDMARHRPIGRNPDIFHRVMHELREIAQAMDELGYWGLSHVEHHFHSEGLELSPDPGLWNLYLGRYTKRLMHGQLGYVLPTRDPLRLAEKIAMLDHMLEGRLFVGIARGYQTRWMNVLGQRLAVAASNPLDKEIEERNKELYFEHYRIMKLAWSMDLLQYRSRHYEVPYPYAEGIPGWAPAETITRRYGVPGEVDENGTIQGISVVPKPFQKPHPQIFQPFSQSESTVRWAAREGLVPIMMFAPMIIARWFAQLYRAEAKIGGRDFALGQNVGLLRVFHIYRTQEEVMAAIQRYDMPVWDGWYRAFGHLAGFRFPDEQGPVPQEGESTAERLLKVGLIIGGTVDEVKRQIEDMLRQVPFEYLVWHLPFAAMPKDVALQQLELFAEKIMPEFGMVWNEQPA
jgi:alkanesulfonate monooxygenase SsuD/methylene tetrahydromethanopterin reductase-like flavin-dependent oxidoreductase (luciferase family)